MREVTDTTPHELDTGRVTHVIGPPISYSLVLPPDGERGNNHVCIGKAPRSYLAYIDFNLFPLSSITDQ